MKFDMSEDLYEINEREIVEAYFDAIDIDLMYVDDFLALNSVVKKYCKGFDLLGSTSDALNALFDNYDKCIVVYASNNNIQERMAIIESANIIDMEEHNVDLLRLTDEELMQQIPNYAKKNMQIINIKREDIHD